MLAHTAMSTRALLRATTRRMMRFNALARFADQSTVTTDAVNDLFAVSPSSAARKWFWRLSADDRARCVEVTVSAWVLTHRVPWAAYDGPAVTFEARGGRLVGAL